MVRLQKFLAEAGVASRRAGEQLMLLGQVTVNGHRVTALGTKVDPAKDEVAVDGEPVRIRRKIYVAVNKPAGYLCTRSDPEKRHTVGELLPGEWAHLFPVGRLDYASEGLVFLTNDGSFCLKLTHPRYGVRKTYQSTVEGRVDPAMPRRLVQGVTEGGEQLKAEEAKIVSSNNTRSVLELVLAEGKNREVRRLLAALGFQVQRLVRTQIGRIRLGNLSTGRWRTLTETEIKSLLGNYENTQVALERARSSAGSHSRRPRHARG